MTQESYFDEDSVLARRAAKGDRAAFESLVEKFQGPIYGYALHFFHHQERAEDLAQETFLRAYRFLHTYDSSRRFSTWLYAIARNLCIDRIRDESRRELLSTDGALQGVASTRDSPLATLEEKEDRRRLLRAIHGLPEKYRTPIILCYAQGLPYQEISEILGISLNNTKIRIFRAKKLILRTLGLAEGEP